jgi:signal transduction histidine kinase
MDNTVSENIDFVVGEEKDLEDILSEEEIRPLLEATVLNGAYKAYLVQQDGERLFGSAGESKSNSISFEFPLRLEGEPKGKVIVEGPSDNAPLVKGLFGLLAQAVQTILTNNLKRLLTTEIHTTVVSQSYDELLQTNEKLARSERKYRELAKNLEIRVEERTVELKKTHTKLLQHEKLAAIGQLAAGMAHEINNPLGFMASNLNTLKKYVDNLIEMMDLYKITFVGGSLSNQEAELLSRKWTKLKLDFIIPDIGELIGQSSEGCGRIAKIVADLKGFSHVDEGEESTIDINREIDRTLSVLTHQIPADAEIIKEYEALPGFSCNAARMSQVFFNIILNSIQLKQQDLRLTIATKKKPSQIVVQFTDNGPGMEPKVVNRIFEPFFTTKDVGEGSGMGLSIAHDIITDYGGTIDVESVPGGGTTFTLSLPSKQK